MEKRWTAMPCPDTWDHYPTHLVRPDGVTIADFPRKWHCDEVADSLNRLDEIEEALADLEDSRRLLPRVVFSPTVDGPSNLDDLERADTRYKRVKRLSIEASERRANR